MKDTTIQTLHPDAGKTNKVISLEKYETIKVAILEVLKEGDLSHTQLMEAIHKRVSSYFKGNAQWYGETVKLDLEARGVIQRSKSKLPIYSVA
ncbi:DUF6958 family protein [Mucilaginibacter gilvus]|uniref:Uncharacterized protein n=1 Tax=Mucilaginibacter gilvus TaxID=2305909 RepID=A0A3S3YZY8_9SPHI|nr:hypothetical protein [Mucilaginibacter gilvus]RWY54147.1 hypothetical protein EPL05_08885 [Mucilaginibacter gilvus]